MIKMTLLSKRPNPAARWNLQIGILSDINSTPFDFGLKTGKKNFPKVTWPSENFLEYRAKRSFEVDMKLIRSEDPVSPHLIPIAAQSSFLNIQSRSSGGTRSCRTCCRCSCCGSIATSSQAVVRLLTVMGRMSTSYMGWIIGIIPYMNYLDHQPSTNLLEGIE